ncbi:MAG: glycoside hydrolase family 5 protein [Planctomycetota bacterium]|jgi:endoglucanase|nr:glycoside hydrolase family 5 protein [Planctomycetota bacterium]MDP6989208.1 glycoside hydrolase family 5 protein [Planctomycetota bacterium]
MTLTQRAPLALAATAAVLAFGHCASVPVEQTPRGINIAGAEFGTEKREFSALTPGVHGVDYVYCSPTTLRYFSQQGMNLVRMPFRWERLQHRPGGELDQVELARIVDFLDAASNNRCRVVLDLHNYGRYVTGESRFPEGRIVDADPTSFGAVTRDHLAILWLRLGGHVRDHPALEAYGLMNEPHDMGEASWHAISQHVVDMLRMYGDTTTVWVSGDQWSGSHAWTASNGPRAWIDDPADRTVYEAHTYFDADASGKYTVTFDAELARDPGLWTRGVDRLRDFADWCERNGVRGVIGEYGVPSTDSRWFPVMGSFLQEADRRGIETCYWAAGDWWDTFPLSVQPRGGLDAPQLPHIRPPRSRGE